MAYTDQWEYRERENYAAPAPDRDENVVGTRRRASSRPPRPRRRYSLNLIAILLVTCFSAALCLGRIALGPLPGAVGSAPTGGSGYTAPDLPKELSQAEKDSQMLEEIRNHPEAYPQALRELVEKNPETIDYVYQYPQLHDETPKIDLRQEAASGQIPLLLQWDARWGYQSYGSGLIGYTGCGPTCLSMVALYLTGNPDYDPATIAKYAEQEGYYVSGSGTSWDLMDTGCQRFGLSSEQVIFEESQMVAELQEGKPLICVLGPGDFTDSGHFIVLTGYNGEGFTIHDPNSPQRSAQIWTFARLNGQVKNIWAFSLSEDS